MHTSLQIELKLKQHKYAYVIVDVSCEVTYSKSVWFISKVVMIAAVVTV